MESFYNKASAVVEKPVRDGCDWQASWKDVTWIGIVAEEMMITGYILEAELTEFTEVLCEKKESTMTPRILVLKTRWSDGTINPSRDVKGLWDY